MNNEISDEKLILIVNNLRKLDSELEHVEFKHSLPDENQIAKTISGITNSMSLTDCPRGYFIWGIHDSTHDVIGTEFRPYRTKVGNEELPFWLSKHITPTPNVVFREIPIEGKRVIVLIIEPSPTELSKFNHEPFIRMGANTTSLRNFPTSNGNCGAELPIKVLKQLPQNLALLKRKSLRYLTSTPSIGCDRGAFRSKRIFYLKRRSVVMCSAIIKTEPMISQI